MIGSLIKKIVGSKNERELKRIQPLVDKTSQWEPDISPLNDDQLRAKTAQFKDRIGQGESLEEILPEAFAVVRETAKRTLGERLNSEAFGQGVQSFRMPSHDVSLFNENFLIIILKNSKFLFKTLHT